MPLAQHRRCRKIQLRTFCSSSTVLTRFVASIDARMDLRSVFNLFWTVTLLALVLSKQPS